jgi:hypothetical protein
MFGGIGIFGLGLAYLLSPTGKPESESDPEPESPGGLEANPAEDRPGESQE